MASMKYIKCRDEAVFRIGTQDWPEGGQIVDANMREFVLIFPEGMTHSVVFENLQETYPGIRAISAGTVTLTEDGWYCHGDSKSLNLVSQQTLDESVMIDCLHTSLDALDGE